MCHSFHIMHESRRSSEPHREHGKLTECEKCEESVAGQVCNALRVLEKTLTHLYFVSSQVSKALARVIGVNERD